MGALRDILCQRSVSGTGHLYLDYDREKAACIFLMYEEKSCHEISRVSVRRSEYHRFIRSLEGRADRMAGRVLGLLGETAAWATGLQWVYDAEQGTCRVEGGTGGTRQEIGRVAMTAEQYMIFDLIYEGRARYRSQGGWSAEGLRSEPANLRDALFLVERMEGAPDARSVPIEHGPYETLPAAVRAAQGLLLDSVWQHFKIDELAPPTLEHALCDISRETPVRLESARHRVAIRIRRLVSLPVKSLRAAKRTGRRAVRP